MLLGFAVDQYKSSQLYLKGTDDAGIIIPDDITVETLIVIGEGKDA